MCWSEGASVAMAGVGMIATVVTARRGEPAAIPLTIGYFTLMEVLQAVSYPVIDQCGLPANRILTVIAYLHISLQPIVLNAFSMALVPVAISPAVRRRVYALASLVTLLMLARLLPFDWAGQCAEGDSLCGECFCTVSGSWHLAWEMPLNDIWGRLTDAVHFPFYSLAIFVMPMFYGAWRFALFHVVLGPVLATALSDGPNEMPAVWCLFSVGIAILGLSPFIRKKVMGSGPRTG